MKTSRNTMTSTVILLPWRRGTRPFFMIVRLVRRMLIKARRVCAESGPNVKPSVALIGTSTAQRVTTTSERQGIQPAGVAR
jgi:hypothetical protein